MMSTSLFKQEKDGTQPVHVYIRIRPLNKKEEEIHSQVCLEISSMRDLIVKHHYGRHYIFDKIFSPSAQQMDIYRNIVKPLIPEVLAGYNCTVFAYGQTGTGKTYTMAGGSVAPHDDECAGIIPRAMAQLFDELSVIPQQYTVRVSFLELYNEELFDLLSDNTENRSIRLFEDQHQKGSVIISGVSTETICNKNQVYSILQRGQEKRRTASTLFNDRSSRSHAVFTIIVHIYETTVEGEELVKTGKLNLVDLAGSESIGRFKIGDRRARETGSVNQSLLTLGRVIKALAEKCVHVPYRESKLTRILQDSLGGRTKTSIIATISPAACCLEETLSTLDYAHRAKCITNRPEINQRVFQKAWKAEYERKMERLRRDLYAARTGTGMYIEKENYDRLVSENEIRKEELAEKLGEIVKLTKQMKQVEEEKIAKETELSEMQVSFQEMNKDISRCYRMLNGCDKDDGDAEKQFICCCEMKPETFRKQARYLLEVTETAAMNFQKKVADLVSVNEENNQSLKSICKDVSVKCQKIVDQLIYFMINIRDTNECVIDTVRNIQERHMQQNELATCYGNNLLLEAKGFVNAASQELENALRRDCQRCQEFFRKIQTKIKEVQNMSRWVDVRTSLEDARKGILLELNKTRNSTNKQRKITIKIMGELEAIGKDMFEIQKSIKLTTDRVRGLENNVHNLTHINHACLCDINKAQVNVEQNLSGICDRIQDNIHYGTGLYLETLDSISKERKEDIAVAKFLEQLQKCKQSFSLTNSVGVQSERPMEAHIQKFIDIAKSQIEANNQILSTYAEDNSGIQKQLLELNENASRNELAIHSMLQSCQDNLTNFMNNGLRRSASDDNIPVRLPCDSSNRIYQIGVGDQAQNSYTNENINRSVDLEGKQASSIISLPRNKNKAVLYNNRRLNVNRCCRNNQNLKERNIRPTKNMPTSA